MSRIQKLFEAGDGRSVTREFLYLHEGEKAIFYSQGWCDELDYIVPHVVFIYPTDICVEAMHDIFMDEGACDSNTPAFTLSKGGRQARIHEPGVYFLRRARGAEDVDVWVKRVPA